MLNLEFKFGDNFFTTTVMSCQKKTAIFKCTFKVCRFLLVFTIFSTPTDKYQEEIAEWSRDGSRAAAWDRAIREGSLWR